MPRMFAFWDGGGTLWNSLPLLYGSYAQVFRDTIPRVTADRVGRELEYGPALCHRLRGFHHYSRAASFGEALVACRWLARAECEVHHLIDRFMATAEGAQGLSLDRHIMDPAFEGWSRSFVRGILEHQTGTDPERYPLRRGAESVAKRLNDADIGFALVSNRDARQPAAYSSTTGWRSGASLRIIL